MRAATAAAAARALPKVELHRHLEGAVRLETVLDEARRHGVRLPLPDGVDNDPRTLTKETLAKCIVAKEPFPDLASLLAIFDRTQAVFCDMETFRRIAREAVEDAAADNVKVLELRYAPSYASMNHDHPLDQVLDAVEEGVAQGRAAAAAAGTPIDVGLICIAVGAMGAEEFARTAEFAIERAASFCGFDCAGAEQDLAAFAPYFARVAAEAPTLGITCHASEDLVDGLPANALCALRDLDATRIGHGVQIVRDAAVVDAVAECGALLEVSVTSNVLTNAVESAEVHPARALWQRGIPLAVCSDDPGIMNITLSDEYALWATTLGFSLDELRATNIYALERSFLPRDVVEAAWVAHFRPAHASRDAEAEAPRTLDDAVAWAKTVQASALGQFSPMRSAS
jgi:adenosine deaminase